MKLESSQFTETSKGFQDVSILLIYIAYLCFSSNSFSVSDVSAYLAPLSLGDLAASQYRETFLLLLCLWKFSPNPRLVSAGICAAGSFTLDYLTLDGLGQVMNSL